jgi:hypothetical protein
MCTAVLIGWDPANPPPSPPLHLGSYWRAFLVSQDRRHLFVTPCLNASIFMPSYYTCTICNGFNPFLNHQTRAPVLPFNCHCNKDPLKVDGNEKLGGFCMALWRSRVILNLNVSFLCKTHYFLFRLLQLYKKVLSRQIGEAGSKCSSQL